MRNDRPSVYLAAPLFNDRERAFNLVIADELAVSASVFLPQRDGALLVDLIRWGLPQRAAEQQVFEQDARAMASADVLVAVLDGASVDEGVAFEIGFMRALGKLCIGLQTDVRRALPTGNNPMIECGLHRIFSTIPDVCAAIGQFALDRSVLTFSGDRKFAR